MTSIGIIILSDVITFLLTLFGAMFVAGMRWGEIRRDVIEIQKDLAQIKGMFTIKLRDEYINGGK